MPARVEAAGDHCRRSPGYSSPVFIDNSVQSQTRAIVNASTVGDVEQVLRRFGEWLDGFGETSFDHQSYFAGRFGGGAKALYYRHPLLGTLAVAPMIFSEALFPAARRLFHQRTRFPIADAHYAMGFTFLYETTKDSAHLARAEHFLDELKRSRSPGFKEYCWGYPFDWVTRNGVLPRDTPFITTLPYVFEAFNQVHRIAPRDEWVSILESIARHAANDIRDFPVSPTAASCGYGPYDTVGGVVNAAAYRAFLLTSAAEVLGVAAYREIADRNLEFVLQVQNPDGSWPYAKDGVRDFVDHFHTCFVMKALAKIHRLTGSPAILQALTRGVAYYLANLFDETGMPKPFSKAPRLTVYKCELYDCAECINLCLLLRGLFPELQSTLHQVVSAILRDWVQPNGAFRARRLRFGWDNVPMHRWAQSQMFRSLACFVREESESSPDTV